MRNDRLGLLAGLYSAARESAMAEPDSYSEDGMNRILLQLRAEAEQSAEPAVKPNVVLVVSESFFDPTRLPGVSFSADPVPNFHTLAERSPAVIPADLQAFATPEITDLTHQLAGSLDHSPPLRCQVRGKRGQQILCRLTADGQVTSQGCQQF